MRGAAHRAVFAGGVDDRGRALWGRQVDPGPAGDLEFRMLGRVAGDDAVAGFEQDRALGVDQDRSERFVTVVQRGAGQIHTPAQILPVAVGEEVALAGFAHADTIASLVYRQT